MAAQTKKADRKRPNNAGAAAGGPRGDPANASEAQAIPTLEWIVAGIGLVIVTAVLGFLLYAGLSENHRQPDIKLSVEGVLQIRNGYLVRVTATNEGGLTAGGVTIEGELRQGADVVEHSETVIEFLPAHSKKRAGLFFSKDPKQFELRLRPHGYEEP